MASKVEKAKAEQGFRRRPPSCGDCKNFKSEIVTQKGVWGNSYVTEKNKRCAIGGFAVIAANSCAKHEPREA